jgi:hypothetical protein
MTTTTKYTHRSIASLRLATLPRSSRCPAPRSLVLCRAPLSAYVAVDRGVSRSVDVVDERERLSRVTAGGGPFGPLQHT